MKTKKYKREFPIVNYDDFEIPQWKRTRRHGDLFPNHCRGIICGPSGCGKTNVMMNLIVNENGVRFENIYIFCKSLYQNKYKLLEIILKPLKNIHTYFFYNKEEITPPNKARKNSIFIFDDIICDKQEIITSYFAMGRHKNIDVFYLGQTYSKIPKQIIRDNTNLLIIFKQDETNIKHIYDDHVNTDMEYSDFKAICQKCWQDKHDFLLISKECDLLNGRYRKGFDVFITKFKKV